ncbi:hypothetical protein NQ038_14635 [Brevibacterium sp. 50QC2O2]|jgi:hypothetical protein|uniref:hypothetical protein n=1 Tax=Brevibacterium TaxID=1696 RepID=UPI00211CBF6C|nr:MULTISPECIES: hypothetical protein [unclassified Brevibacterium]MCQ9367243.1 hypothetical protein [Brevibacterium sp. 91QC2O2]MCQ9385621.1 hypothetical protein [Brevibacterium sp. 68QC2CO]MCQ9389869.1 hypothetical protein [Brevibacterium sp. 50QC2O2]
MRDIILAFALGIGFACSVLAGTSGPGFGPRVILLVVVFPAVALTGIIVLAVQHRRAGDRR